MADSLFPPTPLERLAKVTLFVSEERHHRKNMQWRHPGQEGYWRSRVAQCDEIIEELAALAEEVS